MRLTRAKRATHSRARMCRDIARLARVDDLLSRAGAMMMKTSPKATMWTAGIALSGRLASYLGMPGFTRWQALAAPVMVGAGLLGIGAAMRYVPRVLTGRLTTVAEANDLNLMEDYRKAQALEHLNSLWDKVFWYESVIRYSPAQRQSERERIGAIREHVDLAIREWNPCIREQLGLRSEQDQDDMVMAVLSERPLSSTLERSREGFLVSSLYALRHTLPQSSEAHDIGFRLNLYEDFCDGAYFDASDTKLTEQYAGNVSLTDIKRLVGFGKLDLLRQIPKQISSKLWFFLITRKVAMGAGRAVQFLNDKYQTDAFNSQAVLWPGEEDAVWLEAFPGAKNDILTLRQSTITTALGCDYECAEAVLDRAFLPTFEFATELRARFDPEYCTGELDYTAEDTEERVTNSLLADLQALGYRDTDIEKAKAHAAKIKREQKTLTEYLTARKHDAILKDAPTLRAVRIAYHTNMNNLKKLIQTAPTAPAEIDRLIQSAAQAEPARTTHLIALRLHHQLAALHLKTYKTLARQLAYF